MEKKMKSNARSIYDYFQERWIENKKKDPELYVFDWIKNKERKTEKELQLVFAAFKSYVVATQLELNKFEASRLGIQLLEETNKRNLITAYAAMLKIQTEGQQDFVRNAANQLISEMRNDEQRKFEQLITAKKAFPGLTTLNHIACEGYGRKSSRFTPEDVAKLMVRLANPESKAVDVYARWGWGLYLGASSEKLERVTMVGDEIFSQRQGRVYPSHIEHAYDKAQVHVDPELLLDRMFTQLTWSTYSNVDNPDALLVNAASDSYAIGTSESEGRGSADALLDAPYKKIVLLVPNTAISAGRGAITADTVLRRCLQCGLELVLQLPPGTIGAMHELHSILVLNKAKSPSAVTFTGLENNGANKIARPMRAPSGFGLPRRQTKLALLDTTLNMESYGEDHAVRSYEELIASASRQTGRGQLISFEASRYTRAKSISPALQRKYELTRLSDVAEIYRVQHMALQADSAGIVCREITSEDIDRYGRIRHGSHKKLQPSAAQRLERAGLSKGDILLCIRGPVGKVGIIQHEPDCPTTSTQNFLRIRLKQSLTTQGMTHELLFWWLRSSVCQDLIKRYEIGSGVSRLSIQDIENIEVPIGPPSCLFEESGRVTTFFKKIEELTAVEYVLEEALRSSFIS
jgi:hypothetical protein